jgi:GTP-binding protein HflX
VLVGIVDGTGRDEENGFRELESLAETAGIPVLATLVQKRKRPDPGTFIGRGKVAEAKAAAQELDADVVIFDDDLTPAQARNLEESLGRKVIDRTQLIMDIFAQRAATKEAKLQVELAQLRYLLPRLRGWGMALTRIGGGSAGGVGTRGPGETQLELDRNKINRRIHGLERRLAKATAERRERRKRRAKSDLPQIALVGYTNSGKSTLLNRLCEDETFVEDKLFATLDTKIRRGSLGDGRVALFVDTVGFIRDLPHDLVPAFAATLEAARYADLLLHVVDASKPAADEDRRTVLRTLEEEVFHGDDDRPPMLTALNKLDLCRGGPPSFLDGIPVSAKEGTNLDRLLAEIGRAVYAEDRRLGFSLPFRSLHVLRPFTANGRARIVRYAEDGAHVEAVVSESEWRTLRKAGARLSAAASSRGEEP